MAAIPTLAQEDARRRGRERESLAGEASRIVNRLKSALVRRGVRKFNPKLKKASERLNDLRTHEGELPNTLEEMKRDMGGGSSFGQEARIGQQSSAVT